MHNRAVSTTLSYTLTLSISALLITGLLVAGTDYVNDRREQVVREELTIIGHQVASDLSRADRLVRAGQSPTVRMNQTFPDRVSGSSYDVAVENQETLVLTSTDPEVSVTVSLEVKTDLRSGSTADGGVVQIWYDKGPSPSELVITDV
ncbi:DUF7266 family protein [Haloarcula pellucida]|uniref:Uncharacterized protein n=1 Tax=Haloarcula pellucida TaxID=1427151 RepID=A0A830GP76_9EURY|nr:hypothetical protein [Halomicroarcula pellucida]MBX0348070.1 hypothetical protein [Halomicroarcula pellucida]GGN96766.1 hypothetical protein GCM10009030_25430 [Halomicroarcula pellucida]